jgi:hypothetical protein
MATIFPHGRTFMSSETGFRVAPVRHPAPPWQRRNDDKATIKQRSIMALPFGLM